MAGQDRVVHAVSQALSAMPLTGPCLGFRLLGTPVRLHWSFCAVGLGLGIPAGLLCLVIASHWALSVFLWCALAVAVLVLVHELGHALMARLLSIEVHAVVFAAGGGCCVAERAGSHAHEALYSAAGLGAQAVLLVAGSASLWQSGLAPDPSLGHGIAVFTGVNLVLFVANAWPSKRSDGWRLARACRKLARRVPPRQASSAAPATPRRRRSRPTKSGSDAKAGQSVRAA